MCSKFANQYVLAHWSSPLLLTILQTTNNCNQPHSGAVNIISWQALLLLISFLYLRDWSLIYQSMLPVHWRASNAYFNPSIQTDAAIHRRKMGLTNDITWTWTEWMAFIQKLFLLKFHQNVFQHITYIDQLKKGHSFVVTKRSLATFSGTCFYRGASTFVVDFKSATSSNHSWNM